MRWNTNWDNGRGRCSALAMLVLLLPVTAAAEVDFAHDVLPVLRQHCAKCHTDGEYKGGFSMDTREALLESGHVDPGNSADSELIARVQSNDEDLRMPQEAAALPAAQIAMLERWINAGVPWEKGFTFKSATWSAPLAHRRPALPPGDGNPIDRLVGAYFDAHHIAPPDDINDEAFARRAALDLIGLLPDPSDVASLAEDTATEKRAALIDALLARDHDYAVHWMTFWNDMLRNDYAGTGYIDGGRKQITKWLYQSLIDNKPYDKFVTELVAPGEQSQGFANGIKWRGNVNASQIPELQYSQNVAQVFLGENLKCASCHDSFINDWKLTDAYGLAAAVAETPLELHRCDKPTGEFAAPQFLWPELGTIDSQLSKPERMERVASLMTSPENGRPARTIVNRLWQRLMGRGLVEPVDVMSNQPWSEDLLDFLAADLADHGYDLKHTLRLIANSAIYQAECHPLSDTPSADYVFRGPLARRMTAEQFVDAVWTITETWPEKADAPLKIFASTDTEAAANSAEPRPKIRAALVQSSLLMRTLGRPNREQVVSTRDDRLSTLQALELSNGADVARMLEVGAAGWIERYDKPRDLVQHIYRLALSREPTDNEFDVTAEILVSENSAERVADVLWMITMLPEFQHIR